MAFRNAGLPVGEAICEDEATTQLYYHSLLAQLLQRNRHNQLFIQQYLTQAKHHQRITALTPPRPTPYPITPSNPKIISETVPTHHTPNNTPSCLPLNRTPRHQSKEKLSSNTKVASPTLNLRPTRNQKLKSLLFRDNLTQLEDTVLGKDLLGVHKETPKRSSAHKYEIRFVMEENLPKHHQSSLLFLGIEKASNRHKALRVATQINEKPRITALPSSTPSKRQPLPALSSTQLERNKRCLDIFTRMNRVKHKDREAIFKMLRGDTFNKLQGERRSSDLAQTLASSKGKGHH